MKDLFTRLDEHIDKNLDLYLQQLGRLIAQPSISSQNVGIEQCAELVAGMLDDLNPHTEIMKTAGNPVVYGQGGTGDKTLIFYLHYDVQPPEPLNLWDSPPFELTRRGDQFFGRGISDDKGHIAVRLAAVEAVQAVMGELPCQVKWLVEGEEEIGSPSLKDFIQTHQQKLAADGCIWEFGGVDSAGNPTLTLGMRGIFYVELRVQTATRDSHSGLSGSLFQNAAWRLTWALSSLKDVYEKVLIPGFYDNVVPPTELDLYLLDQLPNESVSLMANYGLNGFLKGETNWQKIWQRAVFEPSCTICGVESGYQGMGAKTVMPAEARAKIDFRLVPDQDPEDIKVKLRNHLDAQGFNDVEIEVLASLCPAKVSPNHPFVELTANLARDVYGYHVIKEPLIGGSGPLHEFVHTLKMPVVTAGMAYPGSRVHAPNENMLLQHFRNGIRHTARIIAKFDSLSLNK